MSKTALSRGESNALVAMHKATGGDASKQHSYAPKGVQWRTMLNLAWKGIVIYTRSRYGHDRWQLTDTGASVGSELLIGGTLMTPTELVRRIAAMPQDEAAREAAIEACRVGDAEHALRQAGSVK